MKVGEITAKFKPYHVDLYCTELEEVSQEIVEGLVGKASMAKSAVISNDQAKRIAEENEKKRRVVDERLAPSLTADQQETLQRLEGSKNSVNYRRILTEEEFEAKKRPQHLRHDTNHTICHHHHHQ